MISLEVGLKGNRFYMDNIRYFACEIACVFFVPSFGQKPAENSEGKSDDREGFGHECL
jgi:hypothetical protein